MFHNQIQSVQQKISSASQMVSQLRQAEENNRQRLIQLANDEAFAAQQMQRVQQLCQECVSNLQSVTTGAFGQQSMTGFITSPIYGQSFQTGGYQGQHSGYTSNPGVNQVLNTQTPLSDIATMGPETYQASQSWLGHGSTGLASSLSHIGQQAGISGYGVGGSSFSQ